MINEVALKAYLKKTFTGALDVRISKLGEGVQGAGFLVEIETGEGIKTYVVKGLFPEGLGHDYPSDRAGVFLLDLEEFNTLPGHVRAIDVLAEMPDGAVKAIGGGKEYYLLMERGGGRDYFNDLREFSSRERLDENDIAKIKAMTSYLAGIHSVKKESRSLYFRKIRDTIGHGECLMGVFDTYPDGYVSYEEMAEIEKLCVDWRARLKNKTHRLARIHGDFHPGNIWFKENSGRQSAFSLQQKPATKGTVPDLRTERSEVVEAGLSPDFVLLDRSRGPWGDPADDITALTINYIFFSIKNNGIVKGAYREALKLFFDEYVAASGDRELFEILAPFFAFRGAVVANPVFYPDLSSAARNMIFRFVRNVLLAPRFEPALVNDYIK